MLGIYSSFTCRCLHIVFIRYIRTVRNDRKSSAPLKSRRILRVRSLQLYAVATIVHTIIFYAYLLHGYFRTGNAIRVLRVIIVY